MESLLRLNQVLEQVGLSRSMLYLLIQRGEFPPPVRLATNASRWPSSEVQDWIEQKIKASRAAE